MLLYVNASAYNDENELGADMHWRSPVAAWMHNRGSFTWESHDVKGLANAMQLIDDVRLIRTDR